MPEKHAANFRGLLKAGKGLRKDESERMLQKRPNMHLKVSGKIMS